MSVELDVEEFVSRCVAVVICYYHFGKTWKDWASMIARIQVLCEEFDLLEVSFDSIRPRIFLALSDRFDRETADRLGREFTDLFASVAASCPATAGHG
jgi:hypothetical protein